MLVVRFTIQCCTVCFIFIYNRGEYYFLCELYTWFNLYFVFQMLRIPQMLVIWFNVFKQIVQVPQNVHTSLSYHTKTHLKK